MLDRIFADIGNQIKRWAKRSYIIGMVISILGGIIFMIAGRDSSLELAGVIIVGFLIMIVGCFATAAFATLLYAFGQLVDDVHAMRDKEGTTNEVEARRKAKQSARREAEKAETSVPQKCCPKCGKQHDFDCPKCPECGHNYYTY